MCFFPFNFFLSKKKKTWSDRVDIDTKNCPIIWTHNKQEDEWWKRFWIFFMYYFVFGVHRRFFFFLSSFLFFQLQSIWVLTETIPGIKTTLKNLQKILLSKKRSLYRFLWREHHILFPFGFIYSKKKKNHSVAKAFVSMSIPPLFFELWVVICWPRYR